MPQSESKAHYVREHGFYKTDDKQPPAGRKSSLKKGQSKPGVKFSKVNRVQSEDGGEEEDDSCIDSEVSSDSSMSVDRPPKSLVWKDRPKSRKVSKIRTVSTIHRTTRVESNHRSRTRPVIMQRLNRTSAMSRAQRNKRHPSRHPSRRSQYVEAVQPPVPARKRAKLPWPHGSGLPGFGAYTGKEWYNEEQDEHDDPPLPATTSNTRRSIPVPKYEDRHLEPEPSSNSKLPGSFKYDKSPGGDRGQLGTGKMSSEPASPESPYHFDFRPDTSSEGSNPPDREPIPNARNEHYPKYFISRISKTV